MGAGHSKSNLLRRLSKKTERKTTKPQNEEDEDTGDSEIKWSSALHLFLKHHFGGNFSSPIHDILETGAKVLEIGCGAGSWTLEMAKAYPRTSFVGIDPRNLFPKDDIPPNVTFISEKFFDKISIGDGEVDLVVARFLVGSVSLKHYENVLLKEIVRLLKPNGWFEWTEPDMQVRNMGPSHTKVMNAGLAYLTSGGVAPFLTKEIPRITSQNNLTLRSSVKIVTPFGKWGGEYGELNVRLLLHFHNRVKKMAMEFMSVKSEEYDQLVKDYFREVEEYHTYSEHWRFCLQKSNDLTYY